VSPAQDRSGRFKDRREKGQPCPGLHPETAITVVYYVPQLTVGGTENQLAELLVQLNRKMFRPAVWCPGAWGPAGDRLTDANIPICQIRLSHRRPISFLQGVWWLRETKPHIFHSFGYGRAALDVLAARLAGVRIVLTSRRNIRHWDPDRKTLWRERLRNRWTDCVLANCSAAAAVCADVEGFPRDRIHVIHNGVKLGLRLPNPELRRDLGIRPADLLVGNVANLKDVKGHDILIRAFRRVVDELPHARLVICGEGEDGPALQCLCRELALTEHVFFLGLRHDLGSIYRDLDLYVHSSRAEGLPNSVLEAMAYGVPVVATSAGGTTELLANHGGDCLVPLEDACALAKAMLRMLKDEALRSQKGLAGQRSVAAGFTVARMVAEHESLYLNLVRKTVETAEPVMRSAAL
jgi:glycosyltransferase involved in cell wall biosynthesis